MGSGLQGHETSRYLSKGLLHRFRCRRQFLFQIDLACFIQNTAERLAISQIQADRQLLLLENFALEYLYSASPFHSRSPFGCASSASTIGSVSHPAGDRPSPWKTLTGSYVAWVGTRVTLCPSFLSRLTKYRLR